MFIDVGTQTELPSEESELSKSLRGQISNMEVKIRELTLNIAVLKQEIQNTCFDIEQFKDNPEDVTFYTGFSDYNTLIRGSDRLRKKSQILRDFFGTKSQKNRPISQEFRGNFWGKLGRKAISKKTADFVVIFRANFVRNWSVLCWSDQGF